MAFRTIFTEPLTETVFRNRNREYGSYRLRRGYLRTMCIASGVGAVVFFLLFIIPFMIFTFQGVRNDLEAETIYEVQYIPFAPPEDLELVELAKAHAKAPPEPRIAPVVSDTVNPEDERPPNPLEAADRENPPDADTASYGVSGQESGRQTGADTAVSTTIDVYPSYPGGEKARLYYLRTHVIYPQEAIREGISGTVMVVFVVEADGSLTGVNIAKGIGAACDAEALRVTQEMPRWIPGKRNGRSVRVIVRMPIVYRMPGK
jgi:protein TonB